MPLGYGRLLPYRIRTSIHKDVRTPIALTIEEYEHHVDKTRLPVTLQRRGVASPHNAGAHPHKRHPRQTSLNYSPGWSIASITRTLGP